MFAGRRTNPLKAIKKSNTYSAVSKDDEDTGAANSRGRGVLNNVSYEKETRALYRGNDISLQGLIQGMKQGNEDCLEDGRKFNLGCLKQ